jgi:hypothetical protein
VVALLIGLNIWLLALAAAFVLGETLLTHRALDRSSRPRAFAVAVWLNGLLWVLGVAIACWIQDGGERGAEALGKGLRALAVGGAVWAAVLGFFAITEDADLTPRQQRSLGEGGRLRRLAMTVLGPGAGRGARIHLLLTGVSLLLAVGHLDEDPAWIIACYGAILLVAGDLLARTVLGRWCDTPPLRRACILGSLVVFGLVPPLVAQFVSGRFEIWLLAMSPFSGIAELSDGLRHGGRQGPMLMLGVAGLAAGAVLLLRALRPGAATVRVTARADDRDARSGR